MPQPTFVNLDIQALDDEELEAVQAVFSLASKSTNHPDMVALSVESRLRMSKTLDEMNDVITDRKGRADRRRDSQE